MEGKKTNKKQKKRKMKINIGIKTCSEVIREYKEEVTTKDQAPDREDDLPF